MVGNIPHAILHDMCYVVYKEYHIVIWYAFGLCVMLFSHVVCCFDHVVCIFKTTVMHIVILHLLGVQLHHSPLSVPNLWSIAPHTSQLFVFL